MKMTAINSFGPMVLLFSILTLGSILRLYNIEKQSYWLDEGYTINATINDTTYKCPIYCSISKTISNINGNNATSFRLSSAMFGILLIIFVYIFTRKLYPEKIALLASLFISLSYWQVAWSRQARWYTLFVLLFFTSIFLFYRISQANTFKRKIIFLLSTSLLTALTIYTHFIGLLLPLIFILYLNFKDFKKNYYYLVFLIPLFSISYLYLQDNSLSFSYSLSYYLNFLIKEYWLFLLFLIYTVYFYKDTHRDFILLCSISIVTIIVSLGSLNTIHYRYTLSITPLIYVLSAIGIYTFIQKIKYKKISAIVITTLLISTSHFVLIPKTNYFLESDKNDIFNKKFISYTPQPEWNKAYDFIKENIKEKEIVISSAPHFTNIFMQRSDYWLNHSLWKQKEIPKEDVYTHAKNIFSLTELEEIIKNNHGYIIYDYMASDNRIPKEMLSYIENNLKKVFYEYTNEYSQVWIYEF